jgi:hypothetical protein
MHFPPIALALLSTLALVTTAPISHSPYFSLDCSDAEYYNSIHEIHPVRGGRADNPLDPAKDDLSVGIDIVDAGHRYRETPCHTLEAASYQNIQRRNPPKQPPKQPPQPPFPPPRPPRPLLSRPPLPSQEPSQEPPQPPSRRRRASNSTQPTGKRQKLSDKELKRRRVESKQNHDKRKREEAIQQHLSKYGEFVKVKDNPNNFNVNIPNPPPTNPSHFSQASSAIQLPIQSHPQPSPTRSSPLQPPTYVSPWSKEFDEWEPGKEWTGGFD